MNYIKRIENNIEIDGNFIKDTINNYIEKICKKNFKSIKTIKNTCKSIGIKRSMPLYINNEILLFPISISSNKDSLYINYFEIKDYVIKNEMTSIIFKNNMIINVSISRYRMNEQLKRIQLVLDYLINYY